MLIPRDFDDARAYDGSGGPVITPGGHICRIQGVRIDKTRETNADMLVVAIDIAEGSEFDGYYKERYERSVGFNKNATWPGVFRATILTKDGRTNTYFKGFIKAVEDSNPGWSFKQVNGDEQTLKGKYVGFNFGEEEYEPRNYVGEIRIAVKPVYAVSVAKVHEGVTPPPRKLLQNRSATGSYPASGDGAHGSNGFTEVDDDELPF